MATRKTTKSKARATKSARPAAARTRPTPAKKAAQAKKAKKTTKRAAAPKRPPRRQPESLRLRSFEPSFTVNDLAVSIHFYTELIGFVVSERWTDEAGVMRGVMLKAGGCELGLAQDDWAKGRDRKKGEAVRIWCQTAQDVDKIAARIKAGGGRLTEEPHDQWGSRSLSVDDPDGFHLTIYREKVVAPPGFLRRLASGAAYVPRGLFFLMRHPRLWPWAALPSLLVALFLLAGLTGGAYVAGDLAARVIPPDHKGWLAFSLRSLTSLGVTAAFMLLGVALALLLSAPILDRLSRGVERLVCGTVSTSGRGWRWETWQSLRGALYFVLISPAIFLLGLIPIVGAVIGSLWGAHALAMDETDGPLARRGLDFEARRKWHRRWRAESLGFGLLGLFPVLLFPLNLVLAPLVTPSLAVGATLLVIQLQRRTEETMTT